MTWTQLIAQPEEHDYNYTAEPTQVIMKNVTFSADERLLEAAREQARADHSTLNEQFRRWLEQYTRRWRAQQAMRVISDAQSKVDTAGRKFSRDELNER